MFRFRSTLGLALLCAAGLGLGCQDDAPEDTPPKEPEVVGTGAPSSLTWVVPVDVTNSASPTQADWFDFAWQSFVAINWPAVAPTASTNRGMPDTTLKIGAAAANGALIPTVWLTFRDLGSMMLDEGVDPGPWNSTQTAPPSGCPSIGGNNLAPGFQPMMLDMISKTTNAAIPQDDVNEADAGGLIDQLGRYVVYDVRLNQSEYTFIRHNKYYNASYQVRAVNSNSFAPFPRNGKDTSIGETMPLYAQYGSYEVKASWRVLDSAKDIFSRYYTQVGYFMQPDGKTCEGPVTFGLVGFHILRLTPTTPSTWYWASFEQVDNVDIPAGLKRPDGSPLTPSFAPQNTQAGNCDTSYNKGPQPVTGNINWSNTNTPVNVCRVTPIGADVEAANTKWRAKLAGTVWEHYKLINTVNPSVSGGPRYPFPPLNDTTAPVNVNVMANTTLETYFQTMSCMSCHGFGTPQGVGTLTSSSLQIFTFLLQNADSAGTTITRRRAFNIPGLNAMMAAH